jgi:chitodextrinase
VTTGHAFSDGFESGALPPKWSTVAGLNVQQAVVDSGTYGAEATSNGAAGASAVAVLDRTVPELYYRVRFQLLSQGANTVSLIRLRNGLVGANPIGSVFISTTGKLGFRNDVAATQVTATTTSVIPNVWHELQLHVNVTSGQVDVWLDGAAVPQLTGLVQSLGANNIGRLELGDPALNRTFDVAFDNVIADTTQIPSDAVPDSLPPTAPGNLRSTATTPSEVDLAWDASTDDTGVTAYRIYRGTAQIASVDGSTLAYADTTVSPSTDYTYTVTAVDSAGHESPVSNSLQVSTPAPPDTTPPTKPTGLTATGAGSQVNLAWNQSTDEVGVTGYNIYRNGSLLTSVGGTTLTYADTNVSPGTAYTYTVSAFDAVPNESPQSDPASVTTDVFSDGFETGNLSKWSPVTGLIAQQTNVKTGTWAAEAKSAQTNAAYAVKTLPGGPYADLYYNLNLKILSGKKDTVDVLRFRTATGGNLLSLLYDSNKHLAYHNDTNGTTQTSTATTLTTGVWYAVKVHLLLNGSSSQIEVWLNGTKVTALSRTDSFPANSSTGQVVAGESSTGHGYDYALDDVLVKVIP